MKIGLVIEGGGMRGLYTAGVIDIMLDQVLQDYLTK
jgi:predicted patatin/cPLA2 family phospholipase